MCPYCSHITEQSNCSEIRLVLENTLEAFELYPVKGEGWSFLDARDWSKDEYLEEDMEESYTCRCPNCGRVLCSACI